MTRTTRLILAMAGTVTFFRAQDTACAGENDSAAQFQQAPVVIYQEPPIYPYSMRLSGNRGEVTVEFIVDPEGHVAKADVSKSSHPDFEAPAVEAVLKWKFKPGMKNGHPVWVHMAVPVIFDLLPFGQADTLNLHHLEGGEAVEPWRITGGPAIGAPPEFQYDEAPKPLLTSAPVYPFDLLTRKIRGKASVMFAVDLQGRTHVVRVIDASLPEFGAATTAMIEAWKFEPAKKGGKPCWALLRKDQVFERDADDFPMNESAQRLLGLMKKDPSKILTDFRLLDSAPKGRFTPSPIVPDSVLKANVRAEALVEFIVDHAGHAQLPRVISCTSDDFGWAAATAVARWQYTTPSKNGKAVDVVVRVPLVFSPVNPPVQGS
jgi:TonB family protein